MNDPRREPDPFPGRIASTVQESTPWWPAPVRPAADAPNIVMVVLDDVGFAQLGCYGSSIRTPAIDALASRGARYNNFHVTALCSTTRACILTGRNHHAVGVGFLSDFDTGFPGYRGGVSPRAAMVSEILQSAGYGTYAAGKWHLVPPAQLSPAGPFHQWPTQRGFDRYYGFLWGEDDQWSPELWYDQHHVTDVGGPDYHLSADLVDRAEEFLGDHLSAAPDRPFFLYLAFGACHAPHQAPARYIDQYAGAFDHGWDEERRSVLRRQIETGLVPPRTELAPRNPGVEEWNGLRQDEKRLFARLQEAFAGFLTHTDAQIGRLVRYLSDTGVLDDTIVMVLSDNGASGEGGPNGTANEYRYFLGLEDTFAETYAAFDQIGGPMAHNHYPMGWAQAGNTPLKYYKRHTYGGGVRAPLIIHWPERVAAGIRRDFHHAIDLAPTLLDLAGVQAPEVYRGVPQLPVHGVSMRQTFSGAAAEPGEARALQYFETAGHRGLFAAPHKLVTFHEEGQSYADDAWELYDLSSDFSEWHDLAAGRPELVKELVARWWEEAARYGVLPLDDRMQSRATAVDPSLARRRYVLLPGARLPTPAVGPSFAGRPFRIAAQLVREAADDGVLLAYGRRAAGFSFFVQDNRLLFDYNLAGRHEVLSSDISDAVGECVLEAVIELGEAGVEAALVCNGERLATRALPSLMPGGLGCLTTQCGHNAPSVVSPLYEPPFRFSGELKKVTIELGPRVVETAAAEWNAALGSD